MPLYRLHLLGAPSFESDGQPVSLDTRKAIALLAYIAMTAAERAPAKVGAPAASGPHSHTRDALATLLWPDLDQSRARAALRRTLSPLRQAVDHRILHVTRDTIGLPTAPTPALAGAPDAHLWVDAIAFQRLLHAAKNHDHDAAAACHTCRDLLEQATALYRDHFMAGFTLRDAPAFDEWQYFQREQLHRSLAAALEQLARFQALQGNYSQAIEIARRHLSLDPLAEQAHRGLMQLYAWSGQRNMAIHQYRETVRILEQELGVEPLPETTALYEQILDDDLPPPVPLSPQPAAPPGADVPAVATLPFVGRRQAWQAMRAAHTAAQQGSHLLIIEGEAGVGKTRLVEEFFKQAPRPIIRARCYEGENNLAYAPIISALRQAIEQAPPDWSQSLAPHWLAAAAPLLPELQPHAALPEATADPGAQSRFFEAIRHILLTLTGRGPHILFIDDVHWADPDSLELLAYLVKRLVQHPLLIVLTWRPEALSGEHPLHKLLSGARRNEQATHLTLRRLSRADVTQLLDLLHDQGSTLPAAWRDALYRQTEGLPFFITEYLKAALDGAEPPSPAPRDSGLPLPHDTAQMPPTVRDLLQARLAGLDQISWQLLNTAATIGRSFHFDICRIASGRSEEEAVAALESLLARGLIEEIDNNEHPRPAPLYDFSHNQIRALVYYQTSLVRRRLLHRRVAEALAQQHSAQSAQSAQIAHHYLLAGQETTAAQYFWQAAQHARTLHAHTTALSHLNNALALGYAQPASVHEALADLQTLLGSYDRAIAAAQAALAHLPADAASDDYARLEHKLGNIHARRRQWSQAQNHFQAALNRRDEHKPPGKNLQARIRADWSLTAHHQGDEEHARQLAHEARQLAQTGADHTALAQVYNILGILDRHTGELARAQEHLEHSLRLATDRDLPFARIAALNNLALVQSEAGHNDRARETLQQALQLCQTLGDRHREAALHNNLADLHHAAGRTGEAMTHLKRAAAIFVEVGSDSRQWQPEIWKLSEW